MNAPVFADTNVLVYARDLSEGPKHEAAAAWVEFLWTSRRGRLSQQVLHEYYATVVGKLKPGLSRDVARADVRNFLSWRPVLEDADVIERAWRLQDRHGLSWWDALVAGAAGAAGCRYLLTEDLGHGQKLDGVEVVSPFRKRPADLG